MTHDSEIIYRKHTFFSAAATGLSAFAVALIAVGTAFVLHGMHLAAREPDKFFSFTQQAVRWAPALKRTLPPSLIEVPLSRRQPDYRTHIELAARTQPLTASETTIRTAIRIANEGSQTVSQLLLRIVVLNSRREVLAESTEWAATPVIAHPEWRGPLKPGCRRYIAVAPTPALPASSLSELRTQIEIIDIRI
jgi:hypothetical protein